MCWYTFIIPAIRNQRQKDHFSLRLKLAELQSETLTIKTKNKKAQPLLYEALPVLMGTEITKMLILLLQRGALIIFSFSELWWFWTP